MKMNINTNLLNAVNMQLKYFFASISACVPVSVVRSVITAAGSSDMRDLGTEQITTTQPQSGSEARLIWDDDHFYWGVIRIVEVTVMVDYY